MPVRTRRRTPRTFTPYRVLYLVLIGPVVFVAIALAFKIESPEIIGGVWTEDGAMVVHRAAAVDQVPAFVAARTEVGQ